MAAAKPKTVSKTKVTQDLYEALRWITRCANMNGPAGTTVYVISDEAMAKAKAAVAAAEGTTHE